MGPAAAVLQFLCLIPGAWAANQSPTRLEYEALLVFDRDSFDQKNILASDMKEFDCQSLVGKFATVFQATLKVDAKGSYVLEKRTTRLFGRDKESEKGGRTNLEEDDAGPKQKGHEHLLGKFYMGQGCLNELQLPNNPAHGQTKTYNGPNIASAAAGDKDFAQLLQLVVGVAQAEETAPTDDQIGTVFASSKNRIWKPFIDLCFMQKWAKYDHATKVGVDPLAAMSEECQLAPGGTD